MKFEVEHNIFWRYDRPVFIEPMTVRLRPRCDGSLNLRNWKLAIDPEPAGICHTLDALGNAVSLVWFDKHHDALSVTAVSLAKTTRENPFDYLLTCLDGVELPLHYDAEHHDWLLPYRRRLAPDDRIDEWANRLAESRGEAQSFLSALTTAMSRDFEQETRIDGPVFRPGETLNARRGACRDLAVLFIDACRSVGIASRFVSGYAYEPDREGPNDLHAWAEVYLTGAGWRGYDPSLGLAVSDRHIPLAAAPEPAAAAATTGTFRETGATSAIEYRIQIQAERDE